MRETKAPENQLIEKLDSIIHSLKTASGNKASLSFVGYKKNLLSLVESKLVSQDAALVEAAFSVTQRFVALLIEKSTQEQVVTPEQFDLIIKSLCAKALKAASCACNVLPKLPLPACWYFTFSVSDACLSGLKP